MTNSHQAPNLLSKGDTIGIISTARKISLEELKPAIKLIESLGYKYKLGKNLFKIDNQFAGTKEERAEDLHGAFLDSDIKAILCARGGYGTVQLLSLLDLELIRKNPKWLIGYSDVTVMHSYLHCNTNLQSLHASMPINFKDYNTESESINSLFSVLEGQTVSYKIPISDLNKEGNAEGVIIGGNLSIIYSLRGTLADLDTDGKILFIEDLDEYLYHIDRIMMNLKIGGKLDNLKALVIGGMSDMNDNDTPFGKSAKQIIYDLVKEYDYPIIFDFPAGHISENYAIPMGRQVSIKQENGFVYLKG